MWYNEISKYFSNLLEIILEKLNKRVSVMKKLKKSVIFIIVMLVVIGSIIGVVLFMKNKNDKDLIQFQQAIENEIKPVNEQAEIPEFISSFRNSYSFEVISIEESSDSFTYKGKVLLTYADVSDELVNYVNSLENTTFDEEKISKDVAEIISKADSKVDECEMYFVKNGEEMQPVFTEEIIDKMYGGIYSSYYNMLDEIATMTEGSE